MTPQPFRTINIKSDMPTVDEARKELLKQIDKARREGVRVLKIIHGYGSTGVGGALRDALRKSLRKRRKEGVVKTVVFGEAWGLYDAHARAFRNRHDFLRNDSDYNQQNSGITLVELSIDDDE